MWTIFVDQLRQDFGVGEACRSNTSKALDFSTSRFGTRRMFQADHQGKAQFFGTHGQRAGCHLKHSLRFSRSGPNLKLQILPLDSPSLAVPRQNFGLQPIAWTSAATCQSSWRFLLCFCVCR